MLRLDLFLAGAAAFLLIASSRPAAAAPIGPDCDTCQGSIYELLYGSEPVGSTATSTILGNHVADRHDGLHG